MSRIFYEMKHKEGRLFMANAVNHDINSPPHRLVFGCMSIGGKWNYSPPTEKERTRAFETLDSAMSQGYTMYDHADIYCMGKSEQLFGEYLRAHSDIPRKNLVIQSKVGIRFPKDGGAEAPARYDFSTDHILRSVEGILSRLGCEYLDVLLLHRPDILADPDEIAKAFDKLHSQGLVLQFGVSNHSPGQMELLGRSLNQQLVANQLELSLGHRGLIEEGILVNQIAPREHFRGMGTLDYCRINGISVQAWSPLYKGKFAASSNKPGDALEATKKLLNSYADTKGCSREALLLAWILRHPAGIVPVIGTTNPDRIRACAQASRIDLSREEWYTLLESSRGARVP